MGFNWTRYGSYSGSNPPELFINAVPYVETETGKKDYRRYARAGGTLGGYRRYARAIPFLVHGLVPNGTGRPLVYWDLKAIS